MGPRATPFAFAAALALLGLLGCGGAYSGAATPGPAERDAASEVITGTCKDYDLGDNTMDVIAGVSFALREVTFRVHEDTQIILEDRRAELSDMRAGMVVRVEYRVTPQGNLADRIEVILDATSMR